MARQLTVGWASLGVLLLTLSVPALTTAGDKPSPDKGRSVPRLQDLKVEPPSFGPPQRGHIYGGPYPPIYPPTYPYAYGYPYAPYPAYPWPPPSAPLYAPPSSGTYNREVIPAGRLALLVDPVSADVYVDGHRLTQHPDLSYEVGLLVGSHTVLVKKEGYESFEQAIEIPPNQRVMLTVRLPRVE